MVITDGWREMQCSAWITTRHTFRAEKTSWNNFGLFFKNSLFKLERRREFDAKNVRRIMSESSWNEIYSSLLYLQNTWAMSIGCLPTGGILQSPCALRSCDGIGYRVRRYWFTWSNRIARAHGEIRSGEFRATRSSGECVTASLIITYIETNNWSIRHSSMLRYVKFETNSTFYRTSVLTVCISFHFKQLINKK